MIGDMSFNNSTIRSISLPKKVKYIGKRVFCKCYELKIIELNNDLQLTSYNFGFLNVKPLIMKNNSVKL